MLPAGVRLYKSPQFHPDVQRARRKGDRVLTATAFGERDDLLPSHRADMNDLLQVAHTAVLMSIQDNSSGNGSGVDGGAGEGVGSGTGLGPGVGDGPAGGGRAPSPRSTWTVYAPEGAASMTTVPWECARNAGHLVPRFDQAFLATNSVNVGARSEVMQSNPRSRAHPRSRRRAE